MQIERTYSGLVRTVAALRQFLKTAAAALIACLPAATLPFWGCALQAQHVAAIQFAPGNVPADNLAALSKLVRQASVQGASAIVLPEHAHLGPLSAEGMPPEIERLWWSNAVRGERLLAGLAKQYAIWIVFASVERGLDGTLTISSTAFDHTGQIAKRQAKLIPDPAAGDGDAVPGDIHELASLDFPGVRIGMTTGDDLLRSVPRLAECGAHTIFVSASWDPSSLTPWRDIARKLAAKHHVGLVIANLAGDSPEPSLHSMVIGRDGRILSEASTGGTEVVAAEIEAIPRAAPPPLGLPTVPQPAGSFPSSEAIALGKKLFFDPGLSEDGKTHCGSCHMPEHAFADGKKKAAGVYGRKGQINTPTLLNSAFRTYFGWQGVSETIEIQSQHALRGWAEMNMTVDQIVEYVRQSPEYDGLWETSKGSGPDIERITSSLGAYVRTLISGDSPFDRYFFGRQPDAIDEAAIRGFEIFRNKAKCASCHEIRSDYALFSDNGFHNTGVGFHKRFEYLGYSGHGVEGNQATNNHFRGEYVTPTLRNISLTAPYMHNGSLATLEDVVEFYDKGGNPNPFLDSRIGPLKLTPQERADLVAFLMTLSSTETGGTEQRSY